VSPEGEVLDTRFFGLQKNSESLVMPRYAAEAALNRDSSQLKGLYPIPCMNY
jgi:hypothetical protein